MLRYNNGTESKKASFLFLFFVHVMNFRAMPVALSFLANYIYYHSLSIVYAALQYPLSPACTYRWDLLVILSWMYQCMFWTILTSSVFVYVINVFSFFHSMCGMRMCFGLKRVVGIASKRWIFANLDIYWPVKDVM